jgi:hypothetical protein
MADHDPHTERNDKCPKELLYKHPLYQDGKLECHKLEVEDVELCLWRYRHEGKMPVLLLHGASAGAQTFTIPKGRSLMDRLHEERFEPWLLDWRGSLNVAERLGSRGLRDKCEQLDFDHTADHDIPAALTKIRDVLSEEKKSVPKHLGAVGFCMGGGTLAQSIAAGKDKGALTHVVLMTLGLFYKTPAANVLKVQDHLLERLLTLDRGEPRGTVFAIDPRVDEEDRYEHQPQWEWPQPLEYLYQNWPGRLHTDEEIENLLEHKKQREADLARMCNRVGFMFGDPYREMNLVPELHEHELPKQFGAIPLKMYAHGARNVRRGWAAPWNACDVVTTEDNNEGKDEARPDPRIFLNGDSRQHFYDLEKVTLITGAMNRLWHRDSIDCMYEWLVRGDARPSEKIRKVILKRYGHQDLLWGEQSPRDVFPDILDGLM